MPIIDPRGYNMVPDASGFSGQIGDIISQNIMQGLAQKAMAGDQDALTQLNVRSPGVGQRIGGILQDQKDTEEQQRKTYQDMAYRVARGYKTAKDKAGYLSAAAQQLRAAGLEDMADEIDDDVATYSKNPAVVDQEYSGIYDMFDPASTQDAATRNFQFMTQGMSPEDIEKARKVELGILPRAGISADERIAMDPEMTSAVASSQATIKAQGAGAAEAAKLTQQAALLPSVRKLIKLAETDAAAKGETFTELSRAKAAMPGLIEVSEKLKALADVATYTTTGKAFDVMSKELGFGSTKGAEARTAMTSIVDNQVLPLLRDTFGAAFTKAEGDSLRATLLDPDMAPGQKKASLDSFIEQKYRNIETKERELGMPVTPRPGDQKPQASGQVIEVDF